MKNVILSQFAIAALIMCLSVAKAQENKPSGYVIMLNEMISGRIEVDLISNSVFVKDDVSIRQLPSNNIQEIQTYSKIGEAEFYLLETFGKNDEPIIFKVLSGGEIALLYRAGLKYSPYHDVVLPPYYIKSNDSVFSFTPSKKSVLELFSIDNKSEIIEFIKSNRLNLKKEKDLTSLFDYCNDTFFENQEKVVLF